MKPAPECPLCCQTPCDPEIDAAVRSIHLWLRERINLALADPPPPIRGTGEKWPSLRQPAAPVRVKRTNAPRDRSTTPQEKRRKHNAAAYAKIKARKAEAVAT